MTDCVSGVMLNSVIDTVERELVFGSMFENDILLTVCCVPSGLFTSSSSRDRWADVHTCITATGDLRVHSYGPAIILVMRYAKGASVIASVSYVMVLDFPEFVVTVFGALICYYYFFGAHQHKAAGMKIKLSKNNDHDGLSHGVKCSQEGDRIPPLKRYR